MKSPAPSLDNRPLRGFKPCMTLIWIALGGALGAVLRYLSVQAAFRLSGGAFPYGTMFVNVAGSLIMGLAAVLVLERLGPGRAQVFLMTGVLGGFTTFSAFSLDAIELLETNRFADAFAYIAGSVVASLLALAAGLMIARAVA